MLSVTEINTSRGRFVPLDECFFFSSRRRHTRFDCDWSSDVCSSDLWLRMRPPTIVMPSGRRSSEPTPLPRDRKSTRLNSSHSQISYAVFCLKKKKRNEKHININISESIETNCKTTAVRNNAVDRSRL